MSKISVIIPVYNTKPEYVQAAVDSVLNQTLKEIEIVIVNDGSTDKNTINFLKNYKNPQIRIINQKNLGLGGARNTGIKYATGKYIGFLDSDDWVDSNFYEKLYNACKQNKADIACGTLSILYQDGTVQNLDKYKNKTTRNNLTKIEYITNGSVCSKLFKKSLFDKTQFAEHLYYEDNPVLLQTLLTARKVTYVPSVHYWYRQHENSIVHDECLAQKRRN
ncbi:MAG: glycosyltransferase family 2 protein, partial [Alphaproteobacteria bacterium]|nr:glycosyltransferase family 2 protein [Alphaproteobacteria bacterium]